MGFLPSSRALGRGQKWVPDPASSAGIQSRNVPFREGVVELVVMTTVLVANGHPIMPPL